MKKFVTPIAEIVELNVCEIITTSPGSCGEMDNALPDLEG